MAERPIAEGTIRFSPDMRSLANVEKSVKKAIGRIENISARGGLLSKNYVQPLGQITGAADEFTKSLEASNARVIAFGASAGIIYNVQRAITASVGAAVELEKTLADINVILNETNTGLQRFSNELFNIAKGTGQAFNAVSEAALEFARQGLAVEETLKRTRDAMILVRLSGLDVKSSVESITATLNSFNKTVINSTELVNKLANVDAAFAVSSADLAEAIRRVGSSAQDSNVNIDQLIALVTTAQQVTARGGSVIGNSLKTIFTRLQRPQVIADLEAFGIVVRDQQQNMLSTMQVLQNFSDTYDQLSPSAKAVTAELVGGVFQINVLKAALGDLGKQYSIYDRALNVSLSSTNEAIARNELLNKTLSTLINETLVNVQKVGAAFANMTITPTLTNVLESVNSAVEKLEEKAADGDLGVTFGKGILQGLSNVLSGPALIAIAGILGKLTFSFFKFSSEAVKTFAGLNSTANQQKDVQTLIQNLLIKNPSLIQAATSSAEGLKMVEQEILKIVQSRNVALNESSVLAAKMSANLSAADFKSVRSINAGSSDSASDTSSDGFVPTFSNGFVPNYNRKNEQAEVMGALQGGYMPGKIDTMQIQGIGRVTYNQAEEVKQFPGMDQPAIIPPRESEAGKNYERRFKAAHGFNPYHQGMIPNFARKKDEGNRAFTPAKVMLRDVIDGDSLKVDFTPGQTPVVTSTRLLNYDAFEIKGGTPETKEKGKLAKKRLEEYIAKNFPNGDVTKLFKAAGMSDSDKYGRPFFQANRFGGALVRAGLAVPYAGKGPRANNSKNKASGFIPNFEYSGLRDEDLGDAFVNVNANNKSKSVDTNLTQKEITKRIGGKTLIRGPEGETLIFGGDLEGRAGTLTVGGMNARKIKKTNPKYAPLLNQVPHLFDGLSYQIMGAVGAKFDPGRTSGAVAGVKFEEEFAEKYGLPEAGAKKGSDFVIAENLAKELGTQKHLQLKLSVFERSKRDVKKVVDVASAFSTHLVHMLTNNIKTQGLSKLVGPERYRQAMTVLNQNPATKSDWTNYFGPKGIMADGFVPNFAEDALKAAIGREMGAGYSRSQVKVGYDSRLAASGGIGVYNAFEGSLGRAINMHRASGKSMKDLQTQGASHGFVPNYATDAGDFLGGGMGLALIAPAVMSMMDSMKEVRAERDKETKSIRGLREALEEAKNSTGHYTEEVTAAETALNESNRIVGQEAVRQSAAEQASSQAESDLAAVRGKKPISQGDIKIEARRARGDADPFAPMGEGDAKITAKQRNKAEQALTQARAQELKDAEDKARQTKQLLDVANEDLEVAEELAEIEGKKLAKAERKNEKSKGIVQAEKKLAEAERNRSGLFDEKGALGNQAISKMGMGLSFAAPMIAGQLSQFSDSNTGVLGRASINALGSGIGTAGIMGTAGAEFGTKITKDLEQGTGLVGDTLGLSADKGAGKALGKLAGAAGPAAMAFGIGKAIDDMGKAMAKAAIQEKADAIGGELELLSTQFNRVQQSGQAFMTSFDKLQQAYDSPLDTNPADVQRVQADLAKALSDAPAEFRNKIKAAAGDADKIREAFSEISTELQRQQAALKSAQDLFSMQADMAAGGGIFSQMLGLEDTTIFEDDAQGKKALSAAKATVAGGLDRAGIIKALEQGRQLDVAGKDMSEFLGEDFKSAFDGLKDAGDQEKIRRIIRKFFKEINDGAADAAKVTKDLERRQASERAYQKQLKDLNTQLDTFVSSLGKVAARVENNLKSVTKLADNIKDFQLDMQKARFEGARTLQQPFLTKQEQVRSNAESRQFEIRADSIKQMRDAIRDGSFNVLNAVSGQFNEAAGKVQQAATDLSKPQSRENVVAFERSRRALEGLAPIIEDAFKTFSQNSGKLDALVGIEKQIESELVSAGYTSQQANAIAENVKQEILSQKDATVNKLSEIAQQQVMQLKLQEEQAYWAQEEAKLQARLNSFGGASDFGRGGSTNLSGNFDKFSTALSGAIGAQISKGVITLGRANSQILDLLLNNMNMDFLRDNVEGLTPLLGPAISGRAADIQSQISFASRLAGIQGVDIDTSGIDSTQIAIEQIASQLKLKDLPDDVAKIRENTTLLNSLIASQAHDIASANRGAFEDALKQTGLHHLDDNTANNILATRVAGSNSVDVGNAIGNTNKDGFNNLIFGVNNLATDLGGTISAKLEPFSTRMAEIGDLVNKLESVQGGQGIIGKIIENQADLGIFETNEEKVEANRLAGIQERIAGSNTGDLVSALFTRTQMEDAPTKPTGRHVQLQHMRKVDRHPVNEFLFGEKFENAPQTFKSDLRSGVQTLASANAFQSSDIDAAFKFAHNSGMDTSTREGAGEAMVAYLEHLSENREKINKFNEATARKSELRNQAATYGQGTGTVLEEGAGGGRRFRAAQNMFEQATGRVAPENFNLDNRSGIPGKGMFLHTSLADRKAGLEALSPMFGNREEQARYHALFDAANAGQGPVQVSTETVTASRRQMQEKVGFGKVAFDSAGQIQEGSTGAGGIRDVGRGGVSQAIASLRGKSLQALQKQLEAAKQESADAEGRLKSVGVLSVEGRKQNQAIVEYNALLMNGINGLIKSKEAEEERKRLIEKMVAETRAQVSTMEAIAGNTPKLTELMELFGDVQRKVLDKKAFSAAEEILKLGVTGGDPRQIRSQIQSQFETGVNALTRVEGGNTELAKERAQRISQAGLDRRQAGLDQFALGVGLSEGSSLQDILSSTGSDTKVGKLLQAGDIIGAAKEANKSGEANIDIEELREKMNTVGLSALEAARMIRSSKIENELADLGQFVKEAQDGLIDSEAISAKVESTFASFVKNGKNEKAVFENISKLRKEQVKQRRKEFENERKTEKEKRKFRLDTKAMEDLNEAIKKGQDGLLTARGTGEAINQAFAAFVEGGFNEKETFEKIKTLRAQEAAKRGEEFGRQLSALEENRQTELTNQPIELNEALQKARKNLMSFAEIGQVIDSATQSYIEKGGDLNKIGKELEQLQLEKSAEAADEFARTLELVNAGLASASLLEEKRKQSFDRIFQERAQQGKGTFGGANRAELQLQKEDSEAAVAAELEAKLKLLNDARKHELLTADELRQKSAELADQMAETGNLGFKGFIGALQAELTYSQADYQKDILSMGREFTRDFKSGMAGAFGEAIRGTSKLKDAFSEMMGSMADKMLDKSLNMATDSAFSFLGFNKGGHVKGYNSGGMVKGGSGVKDDVPAYLSRGEYVIRKSTVNEYGKDFFDSLNSAKVIAANKGGMIDNTRLTRESANRIFSGKSRNMAAIQAERQKRISALQRAGIESYGYKETTDETKKDWLGRDTGQKVLANRVGFRLDFGKPLNENRVKKIQEVVNAYPEVGPFIDPDIFKRSTVEIGGGASKFKLKNSFIYNETKRPDQGRFVADPRLSTLALNDENNPQNKYKFEKADTFFNYQKDRLEYYSEKQKELQDFQDKKANRRRSFLFGAGALLFSGALKGFNKGGPNKEDDIPALLTGGEYVVRKGIVNKYGLNFFENLNRGRISAFNKGGYVAPVTGARPTTQFEGSSPSASAEGINTTNNINISVNVDAAGGVTTETDQGGSRNTDAASQEETKQMADRIKGAVIGVIAEQKRPGGMLYGTRGSV